MPNQPDNEYYTKLAGKFYALEFISAHLLRLHLQQVPETERDGLVLNLRQRADALRQVLPPAALEEFIPTVNEILNKALVDSSH